MSSLKSYSSFVGDRHIILPRKKREKHSARFIVVIGILVIVLLSSLAIWLGNSNVKENMLKISNGGIRGYTSHGVIRINSNSDFDTSHGVVGGSGAQNDPYIISGYDIDAHGAGDAIYIGNTTAYFVVENCYLHNASSHSDPYFRGASITLYNVKNGKISVNNITSNDWGIYLYSSSNNNITNNTVNSNSDGIDLESSSNNNNVINNTANSNDYGIILGSSSNNNITNNKANSNSWVGIDLYSSNNNIINNTVNSNKYGIYLSSSNSNIIKNNTANLNDDGFDLKSSSNSNIIKNNTANSNGNGIYLDSSSNNIIANNTANSNDYGIHLEYASNNNISNNTANLNSRGIDLYKSTNNNITGNTVNSNSDDGIILHVSSKNNNVTNNAANSNNYGIYLSRSTNNNITGNNLTKNHFYSLYDDGDNGCNYVDLSNMGGDGKPIRYVHDASNVVIKDTDEYSEIIFCNVKNSLIDNVTVSNPISKSDGIVLTHSNSNTINNSNLISDYYGIYIYYGSNNNITNNTVNSNSIGINLFYTSNNNIINSTVNSDSQYGIYLSSLSEYNIITNNTANSNDYGIYLSSSDKNHITGNNLTNNSVYSLFDDGNAGCNYVDLSNMGGDGKPIRYVHDTSNVVIKDTDEYSEIIFCNVKNSLIDNVTVSNPISKSDGIVLTHSNSNTINNSNLVDDYYGIYISSGSYNRIYNNSFYYNHGSGDTYDSSHVQAYDGGTNNYWNTSGTPHGYGNYWHDWANNNDTNDNNNDGIVDWAYKLDGSAGAEDHYPLKISTQPIPEFSTGIWFFIVVLIALLGAIRFRKFS